MILGAVFGLLFGGVMVKLEFIGTIWLNCIKMIVVPMVLMTIITGITSQKDLKSLGRIAVRIMVYYVLTTLVATVIGLATASVLKPGVHAKVHPAPLLQGADQPFALYQIAEASRL